jgi:hypothetical protein
VRRPHVDLAVFARVTKVGPREVQAGGDCPRRFQDVEILETLGPDAANPGAGQIVVRQAAGTFQSPTGKQSTPYVAPLLETDDPRRSTSNYHYRAPGSAARGTKGAEAILALRSIYRRVGPVPGGSTGTNGCRLLPGVSGAVHD